MMPQAPWGSAGRNWVSQATVAPRSPAFREGEAMPPMPLRLELDDQGRHMLSFVLAAHKDAAASKGNDPGEVNAPSVLGELLALEFQTVRRAFGNPSADSLREAEEELEAALAPDNAPRDLAPPGTPEPEQPGRGWAKPRGEAG